MIKAVQARQRVPVRTVAFSDATAWAELAKASGVAAMLDPWLTLQCAAIDGTVAALVTVDGDAGRKFEACWPEAPADRALAEIIATARQRGRGVLEEVGGGASFLLAYPLSLGTETEGGVAIELGARSPEALHAAMRQVQWGMAWLRERILAERFARVEGDETAGRTLLDVLATALEPADFRSSARAVATELARRLDCERVSVGMVRGERMRLVAISHTAHFGKDMNLVRLLGEAMDEAVDQAAVIAFPAPVDSTDTSRAHEALAAAHGAGAVLTLPMHLRDRFIGAITLERDADRPFTRAEAMVLDAVATALAPVLEEKRLNDRLLVTKAGDALMHQLRLMLGPGQAIRKAALLGAVLLVLLFAFWKDTYRVTADALVEGRVHRAVVVSFNGFLREAPVRAGDIVREGDLLAALDDRELVLERLRWVTERQRRAFEYEKALGERNRGEARVATNQIEQADAQIQLVEEQLSRARLLAPFDGLVVAGDHSQSIGAAVQRGQVMFEVAPVNGHRVMLQVDETQVASLQAGQTGQLVLAALPGESFAVEIVRITPVARAEEGRNVFRVEARPTGDTAALRPGMRGAAKIAIDQRHVIWIWTRTFMDWARLAVWRWLP